MTRHSDPALFSEAESTLVDTMPGNFWDGDAGRSSRPSMEIHDTVDSTIDQDLGDSLDLPESLPEPPVATAAPRLHPRPSSMDQAARRQWTNDADRARQNLAERKSQREALARVIALAKPRAEPPRRARTRPSTRA